MTAPKVSVLVPVYNGEPFLAECLDSILAQDFLDCEILIGDDGSADGSAGLIEKFAAKDSRIRWWKNPRNLGLTENFNRCLREAKGEYVKYVLQDDKLLSPSAIRQMVVLMESNPAISLVASASYVIDENSRAKEMRNYFHTGIWDGKKIIVRCLERAANLIGEPTLVMFRNRQSVRGYDPRYRQFVDLEMWFHLLEDGKFGHLAAPLCAFRRHAMQQTNVNRKNGLTETEGLMLLEDYFSKAWLREMATRRMLFAQIYALRKLPAAKTSAALGKAKLELGPGWYAACWLHRKITRPFLNLWRAVKKRAPRTVPF
jgi:glycosyltransferase involved in cell wall biosynthesis